MTSPGKAPQKAPAKAPARPPQAGRKAIPAPAAKPRWKLGRPRRLPATIFAAVLLLGVRVVDVWAVATGGEADMLPTAGANTKLAPEPVGPKPVQVAEAQPVQVAQAPAQQPAPAPAAAPTQPRPSTAPQPSGSPDGPAGFTPTEVEILKRLSERREALDQREAELNQREALLQVAEQRIGQQVAKLDELKKQIEGLRGQLDADQQTQVESLVRIYETMKPKEAARIFEAMEDKVLLNVITRMKESKSAPILAAMDPVRAKQVSTLMMNRNQLPGGAE